MGKTALIQAFAKGKLSMLFEAIEGEDTQIQIRHFLHQLSLMCGEPHLKDLTYSDWPPVFDLFTQKLNQQKELIVCFDELPWMAAGRSKLVSYLKFYWDRYWKEHPHLLFIFCGSIASWMIKNVVRSKALYGRISENILLDPLTPSEVYQYIGKKRGKNEVLEYLLCFGGIPRYLEEFDFNKSIQLNIERTCFHRAGFFFDEAEKIFYNQFKETSVYRKIVTYLLKQPSTLQEVSEKLKMPSGGGLKQYLDNLIAAGILERIPHLKDFAVTKTGRYHVVDEYLRFHYHFIRPFQVEIQHSDKPIAFEKVTHDRWHSFLGLAFERFCLKHRYRIAEHLGFADKVIGCGGVFDAKKGFQYDLIFLRNDQVLTLCEVKYLLAPPSTRLIQEFESKLAKTRLPSSLTIEKVLLTNHAPSEALAESGYFHQVLDVRALLE